MPTVIQSLRAALAATAHPDAIPGVETPAQWALFELRGRLSELSGKGNQASLSLTIGLVLNAQHEDEPAAWITTTHSAFFPPDVADAGVDLDALVVLRLPDTRAMARAADKLVRSGAFGLVIVDLPEGAHIPTPLLSRLVGLIQKHDTALLCLTDKQISAPSLDALVSLRAESRRTQAVDGLFHCELEAVKDKRRGPGWRHLERFRPPPGLTASYHSGTLGVC